MAKYTTGKKIKLINETKTVLDIKLSTLSPHSISYVFLVLPCAVFSLSFTLMLFFLQTLLICFIVVLLTNHMIVLYIIYMTICLFIKILTRENDKQNNVSINIKALLKSYMEICLNRR